MALSSRWTASSYVGFSHRPKKAPPALGTVGEAKRSPVADGSRKLVGNSLFLGVGVADEEHVGADRAAPRQVANEGVVADLTAPVRCALLPIGTALGSLSGIAAAAST